MPSEETKRVCNYLISRNWQSLPSLDGKEYTFFENKNWNYWRMVCVVEKSSGVKKTAQDVKKIVRDHLGSFELRDVGLSIVFFGGKYGDDPMESLSLYAEKVTLQMIVQFSDNRIYVSKTWASGITERQLGNFLEEIFPGKEVLTKVADGGKIASLVRSGWIKKFVYSLIALELIRRILFN